MKWWGLIATVVLSGVVFSSALGIGWLSDDFEAATLAQNPDALSTVWTSTLGGNVFRPVGFTTLVLEAKLGETGAWVSHLVNVLLHGLNAWLIGWLVWRLGQRLWPAVLSTVAFLLYPAHVEAVAWIAGRFDVLMTTWVLTACLLFVKSRRMFDAAWWGSLLCAVGAFLTKESSYIVPALLFIVSFYRGDHLSLRGRIIHLLPLVAALGGIVVWRSHVVGSFVGGYEQFNESIVSAMTRTDVLVWLQSPLVLLVRWLNTGLISSFTTRAELLTSGWLIVGAGAALLFLAWRTKLWRVLAVGLVLAWLAALPTLPLLHTVSRTLESSRFWYLPSAFVLATLAWLVMNVQMRLLRRAVCALVLVSFLIGLHLNLVPWVRAGQIQQRVTESFTDTSPKLTNASWLLFERLPDNFYGAYIFRRGFGEWLDAQFPNQFPRRLVASRTNSTPFTSCAMLADELPTTRVLEWKSSASHWELRSPSTAASALVSTAIPNSLAEWTLRRAIREQTGDNAFVLRPTGAPVTVTTPIDRLPPGAIPALELDATITAGRSRMPLSLYWATETQPADEFVQHVVLPVPADGQRHTTVLPLCQYAPWMASEPITELRLQFPRDLRTLIIHNLRVTNAN